MVRHKLSVEEAKSMMLNDPKKAENAAIVGFVLLTIIGVIIIVFVWMLIR